MSSPKPLSRITLPLDMVRTDRRKCVKYDQCGLGQKAIYMGSAMSPRKYYIPYEAVTHVFRRVGVSNGAGKGLLAPILYIVVQYDDGKEYQCSFRYMQDADKMLAVLSQQHPDISLLSPAGEQKAAARRAREEALEQAQLSDAQEHEVRILNQCRIELEKRPSLYEKLAVTARKKRTQDLIKPAYQKLALLLFIAGGFLLVIGVLMALHGGFGSIPILIMLIGAAMMFMMVNSRTLPTRSHSRKKLTADYEAALAAMQHSINSIGRRGGEDFPLPSAYAHPVVIDRMIRIIREGRADTAGQALAVLKEDLRAADSSVALSGKDYEEVVLIKPLFTVNDYQ